MAKKTGKVPPQQEVAPQGIEAARGGPETEGNMQRLAEMQKQGKATQADTTSVLEQAAFAMLQEAISDLWAAMKEDDVQLKVNALQAWINTAAENQKMGVEKDLVQMEGIEAVKLLLEQIARAKDGTLALQAAVFAQMIGVPVPSVSKPAVDQHVAEAAAKSAASSKPAGTSKPAATPR